MPSTPRVQPPPPPLETSLIKVGIVGTALWIVAAIILATVAHDWLTEHGREWWLGTAVTGIVLGLGGTLYACVDRSLPPAARSTWRRR